MRPGDPYSVVRRSWGRRYGIGQCRSRPGQTHDLIEMEMSEGRKTLALGPDYRVEPGPDFFAEVKALLGAAAVT